ncbi:hypothetical protein OB955_09720 [Halobacteria archaeon AArc-m2/3/4]|uniref:Uncharacterized protein n=1 Tax=Natronoglomus mannanivorans TaxID=2979990 RepID=A0ABT2QDL9_9EURY|nr:hypothetical protein [Halobacteria archaeon AArc-m2/3/4]
MVSVTSTTVAALGVAGITALFAIVYWDARRIEMGRPRLWAAVASGAAAVGLALYLFVPTAPMTGVIMTSNTGLVLYTFEREVSTEEDDPADPGWLPNDSAGGGKTLESTGSSGESSEPSSDAGKERV